MAHFVRAHGGERISGGVIGAAHGTLLLSLDGPNVSAGVELDVRASDARVSVVRGSLVAGRRLWTLYAPVGTRARIDAVTPSGTSWDHVHAEFGGRTAMNSEFLVRPITREVLGASESDHLVPQPIPAYPLVDVASFRAGVSSNVLRFRQAPPTEGRIGLFACSAGASTRAAMLLVPRSGAPTSVLVGVTHAFGQGAWLYGPLGYSNPLSVPFLLEVGRRFVRDRWGPQVLAGHKSLALLLLVRAHEGSSEMGPFSGDGAFLERTITAIETITGGAFTHRTVEFFTYSNGISALNSLLESAARHLTVGAVYNIDPAGAHAAAHVAGATLRQYLSGQTGGPRAGFEYLPFDRWANEADYSAVDPSTRGALFDYLHNGVMPSYCLYLGIQTS